jgi:VIT1/CCC1 family predicted Fe2+/Mn2+ transporter
MVVLVVLAINIFMKSQRKDYSIVVRNFTFGVEDSLVSTVGLLAGIAVAGLDRPQIIITGFVLIFVEAFSMAVGSILSEQSVEEYQVQRAVPLSKPLSAGLIMFFSYIFAGLIPLAPYFYLMTNQAVWWSVGLTLLSLVLLGMINAKMFRARMWRDGLVTLLMGSVAIVVGIVVGQIAQRF